jgi:LEA14-like dessication related protein
MPRRSLLDSVAGPGAGPSPGPAARRRPRRTPAGLAGAVLAVFLAALALSACSGLGLERVFQQPTVELEGAQVLGLDLQRADLRFDFRVGNPNGVTLPLSGIDYELLVNGGRLLQGTQDRRIDIAPRGESRVELPVSVRYQDLIEAWRSLRDRDRSGYEIRADFLFDVPLLGQVRVPVKERGDLNLPSLPSR